MSNFQAALRHTVFSMPNVPKSRRNAPASEAVEELSVCADAEAPKASLVQRIQQDFFDRLFLIYRLLVEVNAAIIGFAGMLLRQLGQQLVCL